jgi:outer membrane receptor protein involved in Fe transport
MLSNFKLLLLFIFAVTPIFSQVSLTGRVISPTGEPLAGCAVFILKTPLGVITGNDGNFSFDLTQGNYSLRVRHIAFSDTTIQLTLSTSENKPLTIILVPASYLESEVVVYGDKKGMDKETLEAETISSIPTLNGEVLQSIRILPGVKVNNEMTSGYNVRGGSFDENLIYLNGFEIYRPFLLRQGIEENQSLINQDLIKDLNFYGGAFPANFGDKMSSALLINYGKETNTSLSGIIRASLLSAGVALHHAKDGLSVSLAGRWSYPKIFSKQQHTSGDYRPDFKDIQLNINYMPNTNISTQIFLLRANNKYDLTPTNWTGNFRLDGVIQGISADYSGATNYGYNTSLAGINGKIKLNNNLIFGATVSYFSINETENRDLKSDIYLIPDAYNPDYREYLKSALDKGENILKLSTMNVIPEFSYNYEIHTIKLGSELKFANLQNSVYEEKKEQGGISLPSSPEITKYSTDQTLNSYSFYVNDEIEFNERLELNAGLRYTSTEYNGEKFWSPRAAIEYKFTEKFRVNLRAGVYNQPPFFYELRDLTPQEAGALKSQKSTHYIAALHYIFKKGLELRAEFYYKSLSDLVPVDFDGMRIFYGKTNSLEGYARGFDIMLRGEIQQGLNSWFVYGYLDSGERLIGSTGGYDRRLLDQTHNLQIFLQDKIRKHPNWQSHLRFSVATGNLYHPRRVEVGTDGKNYIVVDYNKRWELPFYMRADMGLSAKFQLGEEKFLTIVAEVLNVFNNYNIAGYSWYQVIPGVRSPLRVSQIFTERFFNLSAEFSF